MSKGKRVEIAGKLMEPYFHGTMHIYIMCFIPYKVSGNSMEQYKRFAVTKNRLAD